jgi:hypothetical protein
VPVGARLDEDPIRKPGCGGMGVRGSGFDDRWNASSGSRTVTAA